MFALHLIPPAGTLIGIAVHRNLALRQISEPVGTLPPQFLAETGPRRLQMRIKRGSPRGPCRFHLFGRPSNRVMLAISLQRPRPHPVGGLVNLAKAADIHWPQIIGRLAL